MVYTGAENLAPTGIRFPDRPARSQSLYRLRYRPMSVYIDIIIKKKVILEQAMKAHRGRRLQLYSFFYLSARFVVGGQRHAPAALPAGKTRYPLYRKLGGPQGRSGQVRNISPPLGFDPRPAHPLAPRYTD